MADDEKKKPHIRLAVENDKKTVDRSWQGMRSNGRSANSLRTSCECPGALVIPTG
ncbi:hypothetical protein BPNPMPFG_008293 (plasmid) [Mesorhizobium sp. AR07]|uniref:hypothetical protein n=1 Tax=Mesorhizobium sp. AR07 TaxID=2865838 RepID=UPI00215FAFA2|nr:hypothetical protein [Mesorhizobium sp. AR07]UVK49350.1 hypothetical protein BPNPMPFG_008293 [Mesorhizobium sp. AR07]